MIPLPNQPTLLICEIIVFMCKEVRATSSSASFFLSLALKLVATSWCKQNAMNQQASKQVSMPQQLACLLFITIKNKKEKKKTIVTNGEWIRVWELIYDNLMCGWVWCYIISGYQF